MITSAIILESQICIRNGKLQIIFIYIIANELGDSFKLRFRVRVELFYGSVYVIK